MGWLFSRISYSSFKTKFFLAFRNIVLWKKVLRKSSAVCTSPEQACLCQNWIVSTCGPEQILSGEVCSKQHNSKGLVEGSREPSFSSGKEETPPPYCSARHFQLFGKDLKYTYINQEAAIHWNEVEKRKNPPYRHETGSDWLPAGGPSCLCPQGLSLCMHSRGWPSFSSFLFRKEEVKRNSY